MNIDNLSYEEIEALEKQKAMMKFAPSGVHPDRINIENMSEEQLRTLEAQRNRYDVMPTGVHPDRINIENMSDDQIRSLEAQRNRYDVMPSGVHPDRINIENMSEEQLRALEAQVAQRKQTDIPFKEYFENLLETQVIINEKEFEEATIRSMQSNGLIKTFINGLIDKITEKVYEFKTIDKNNKEKFESTKQEVENLINIYEKYLYTLKNNGWEFTSIGFDVESLKIPEDVQSMLWKIQKNNDTTFSMLIPANLGEDYGQAFERNGKMIPGLTIMYEDLKGKSVNWHQVLIYRENELTPYEKYKLRMLEKYKEQNQSYEMKL